MYHGFTYRPPLGVANGHPATPAMLIFTCANGVDNESPPGGQVWNARSKVPC
jgi:hypothetical protein